MTATEYLNQAVNNYLNQDRDITVTGGKIGDHEYLFEVDVKGKSEKQANVAGYAILAALGIGTFFLLTSED